LKSAIFEIAHLTFNLQDDFACSLVTWI